jgi:DNA polymerase III epsilon subunit-like protein
MKMNRPCLSTVFVVFVCLTVPTHGFGSVPGADSAPDIELIEAVVPEGSPSEWRLMFLDIETTGLDPEYNEPIDAGIVISGLDGTIHDTFFRRIMPEYPGRISEGARKINGFSVERWRKEAAIPPRRAVSYIKNFIETRTGDSRVLLVAYNSEFDVKFLRDMFRTYDHEFDPLYDHVLDMPAFTARLGLGYMGADELVEKLGVRDEPRHTTDPAWEHTGLTGAKLNYRLYRALVRNGSD